MDKRRQEMMQLSEIRTSNGVDVRVIGVGGAGCSTLSRLAEILNSDIRMLGIDTGSGTVDLPRRVQRLPMGNGYGSGGDIDSASTDFAEIQSDVEGFIFDADVVVVLAGLGRGTGSGLAPLIAGLAQSADALAIAAVNMPFEFEGRFRNQSAASAHAKLSESADAVITLDNEDLSILNSGATSMNGAFHQVGQSIARTVNAITTAVGGSTERFIAVRASLSAVGKAAGLSGTATGLHAGREAVIKAFAGTTDNIDVAKSAVIHIEGGIGLSLGQVAEAVAALRERIGSNAVIHVASERHAGLGQDIHAAIVVAGFGNAVPEVMPIPSLTTFDRQNTIPSVSIFDTPAPLRTRGPELLPTG
jgi:cell division protein FtsZ